MPRIYGRILAAACCLAWTVVYVGFFFYRSHQPVLAGYSLSHCVGLLLMILPYGVPWVVATAIRRWGGQRIAFALVPAVAVAVMGYAVAAVVYGNTQRRPFDPYTQFTSAPLPKAPTPSAVRILVLGGSTSIDYPDRLLPRLKEAYPHTTFDLVNEAKGHFTIKHSLINFTTYYDDYRPDLVLCLHGINDLTRSFSAPIYALGKYNERWTHFYGPAFQAAAPPSLEGIILRRPVAAWFRDLRVREVDFGLDEYLSLQPYLRHTERLLAALKANGATPVVLTQPTLWRDGEMTPRELQRLCFREQMCIRYTSYWRQEYPTTASLTRAMADYNAKTTALAERSGALCVDAAAAVPRDLDHFIDDCHFTSKGLDVVADTLTRALVDAKTIDRILERRKAAAEASARRAGAPR